MKFLMLFDNEMHIHIPEPMMLTERKKPPTIFQ
jgi:hypothetical protein